jgi:hypothetical protein
MPLSSTIVFILAVELATITILLQYNGIPEVHALSILSPFETYNVKKSSYLLDASITKTNRRLRLSSLSITTINIKLSPVQLPLPLKAKTNSDSESSSFFTKLAHESNESYFQRITNAASDPLLFEQMVLQKDDNHEQKQASLNTAQIQSKNRSESTQQQTQTNTQKSGYVRAEIWEEEQQKQKKEMSWNEKVQFDGQRYGNQYLQNEILRKNLKGF